MSEFCKNCRFGKAQWSDETDDDNLFFCRRRAPGFISASDLAVDRDAATEWVFPVCLPEDWCGEYEAKAVA